MNTCLQVEHPVTEMITGLDLVAWQLLVAEGEPLPLQQEEVRFQGHAIQARLYAEAPEDDFLPSTGQVHLWSPPAVENNHALRIDHGLVSGVEITPYYDAMIAKIIVWGENREIARRRLQRALDQTSVLVVATNREFLLDALSHPIFAKGQATTSFIQQAWQPSITQPSAQIEAVAATLFYLHSSQTVIQPVQGWRVGAAAYALDPDDRQQLIQVKSGTAGLYVEHGEQQFEIKVLSFHQGQLYYELDGLRDRAWFALDSDNRLWLQMGRECASFRDLLLEPAEQADSQSDGRVVAPMPGAVLRVDVAAGDSVHKGQALVVLEAMKMEHTIVAPVDGTVEQVLVVVGQQMKPPELMVMIVGV